MTIDAETHKRLKCREHETVECSVLNGASILPLLPRVKNHPGIRGAVRARGSGSLHQKYLLGGHDRAAAHIETQLLYLHAHRMYKIKLSKSMHYGEGLMKSLLRPESGDTWLLLGVGESVFVFQRCDHQKLSMLL